MPQPVALNDDERRSIIARGGFWQRREDTETSSTLRHGEIHLTLSINVSIVGIDVFGSSSEMR